MSLHLVLFPCIALAFGLVGINLLWPRSDLNKSSLPLRLTFAVGLGMGLLSFAMFFWLLAKGSWTTGFNAVLYGALGLGAAAFFLRRPRAGSRSSPAPEVGEFEQIARTYFLIALLLAAATFVIYFLKNPHGNWDAWSHWNLRARFVFHGADKWANALHPEYWNPLNYPLLWPMAIAAGWGLIGTDSPWIPGLTAMLFALACALLLTAALARLRGKTQGYIAGILLLGTPFFLTHGTSQYSDIPLAFFFLASLAAAAAADQDSANSSRFFLLSGVMAGLAAWTKNEGLLFIGCFFTARLGNTLLRRGWRQALREAGYLGAGLLPVLAVDLYVKTQLYAPRTIFETRGVLYNFANFTNLERYRLIAANYWKFIFEFGHWPLSLTLLLIFYCLWMGRTPARVPRSSGGAALLTVGLMLAGYFAVYLSTPHNLNWHLGTSIDRLFLCLWPSFLFGCFLMVRSPEEAAQGAAAAKSPAPQS